MIRKASFRAESILFYVTVLALLGHPHSTGAQPLELTVELEVEGPFLENEPIFLKVRLANVTERDLDIVPFGRPTYPTWRLRVRKEAETRWQNHGGQSVIGWRYHRLSARSAKSLTYGVTLEPGSYVASALYYSSHPAELDSPPSWKGIVSANEVGFVVQAPQGVDVDANKLLYGEVAKAEDKARERDPTRYDPYPIWARYRKCLELYPQSTYAKYCAHKLADYPRELQAVIDKYPRFCYTDDAQLKIAKYYLQGDGLSPEAQNPALSEPADLQKAKTAAQKVLDLYPDSSSAEEAKKILAQIEEKLKR